MKMGVWVMVAALALASTASAQNKKITPKGMGGFSSGTNLQTPDVPEGQKEGPKENRSFQKFINGSVSQARVPSSGVPTPAGLPVTAANPAFLALTHLDQRLGAFTNVNLAENLVPVNADVRAIDVILVPEEDPHVNPIGAKGIGEVGIVGVAPAIANAVYHATGKRVRDLPITIEKLL